MDQVKKTKQDNSKIKTKSPYPWDETSQAKRLSIFFFSCLKISAFTFGGGYVIVPLQKRRFSEELQWIDEEKVIDLVAMAQSAPGPVAINASVAMGYYLFGFLGALLAVGATILPPLIILSIISLFYKAFAANEVVRAVLRGMQASVAALIVYTVLGLAAKVLKQRNLFFILLMFFCLLLVFSTEINVIFVILAAALLSLGYYFISKRRAKL